MSDGTTTTGHEPMVLERFTLVPGGGRADYREETVCVSCWIGCDDETCTEPHGNAPWPCEVARLRERVAALEAAGNAMSELVVRWMESATFSDPTDWYECRDCEAEGPAPEILRHEDGCAIGRWLAALAQAGEGGAA